MKTLPAKEEIKENPFLKYETMAETIKDVYEKHPGYSIGVIAFTNNMVSAMVHQLQKMGLPASEEGGNYIDDVAPCSLDYFIAKTGRPSWRFNCKIPCGKLTFGNFVSVSRHRR